MQELYKDIFEQRENIVSTTHDTVLKTIALAERLEADIKAKGLKEGDSYFSTQEASRFLGVGGSTANKVLQYLEKRRIIQRRQRVGAVIMAPGELEKHSIERIHFLVHEKYLSTEGIGGDGILLGLRPTIPTASVNLFFLQYGQEASQVSRLVDQSLHSDEADAFVLVRTPYEVQRLISDSRLPAVVHGACYTGIENISNIDRDHAEVGRLVLSYVRERNRKKPVYMMRQIVLPGDKKFLDSLSTDTLPWRIRFIPSEDQAIFDEARELVAGKDRPDICICQTRRHAEGFAKAMEKSNLVPGEDIDIFVLHYYLVGRNEKLCPHVVSAMPPESIGKRIGELLIDASENKPPVHENIPVRLSR